MKHIRDLRTMPQSVLQSIRLRAILLAFVCCAVSPHAEAGETVAPLHADLVVTGANVITIDEENPHTEALAVRAGRFVAVGSREDIDPLIGPQTVVIDASGKTVTPGFIDAHMHPEPVYPDDSPLASVDLSPGGVASIEELIVALREKARLTPQGQWVRGERYQDTKLGRHPTRHDLDRASTEHPILITHSSGHLSVANSFVLRAAGATRDTPDPPGGSFGRDQEGEPNGILREGPARAAALRGAPPLPVATREQRIDGILRCFAKFAARGITSVADASSSPDKLRLYQDARAAGQQVRIYAMMLDRYLPDLKRAGLRTGFGNDSLRIGAIKVFHGNSLSGRTCWLYEPYADQSDYYGIPPARSQQELDRLIYEIHEAGFQAAVHSNGDREIDMVLEAIEKATARLPREDHRHRIEHASVSNERILREVKRLGVVLALHSYVYEHGDKMEAYGAKRISMMHPNRTATEMGIPVAGNSDYSVSAADPLLRIQSMVTRTSAEGTVYGAEQRVSPEEAIRIWTLGSAFATFEEHTKGSIQIGKLADFVILSDDPTQVAPDTIKDIAVERTVIGGEVVYERQPMAAEHDAAFVDDLDYVQFDQTLGRGWRKIAASGNCLEAAKMIDSYVERHSDLESWQCCNLSFHAGQLYAFANKYEVAIKRLKAARHDDESKDNPVRWNAYVNATIAFLEDDLETLRSCRDDIAKGPKIDSRVPNLGVVERLIENFGNPYSEAYRAQTISGVE